jgi:polyhydroxybutyrate depolymerase
MATARCLTFAALFGIQVWFPVLSLAEETATSRDSGTWTESSLRVEGLDRWYRVYRPKSLACGAPVVVLLHGGTQSMREVFHARAGGTRAWKQIADRDGVLLIVPNGVNPQTGDTRGDNQNWNDLRADKFQKESQADDVTFIVRLLDELQKTDHFESRRVYVTGASNGGMMAYRLLIEVPERFAAAATFIAVLPAEWGGVQSPKRPTPLMIVNGTKDPLVSWDGGVIRGQSQPMMSVANNLKWWVRTNQAEENLGQDEALPDLSPNDGCRIFRTLHRAHDGGAPVLFLMIEGGGHALPSRAYTLPESWIVRRLIGPVCRDAEGAELAWEFMAPFQR